MSLNLFRRLDRYDRRIRQLERTEPEAGGGGGGDHADSDHADAFSPLAHTHAVHADSDHDDRFSLLAHTHAGVGAHTHDWVDVTGEPATFPPSSHDTDHDDRFSLLAHVHTGVYAPVEHDSAHDDRFSLLAHTHAVHADSDHDDRFSLLAHSHGAPGAHTHDWADVTGEPATFEPTPKALDWLTDTQIIGPPVPGDVLTFVPGGYWGRLPLSSITPAPGINWLSDVDTAGVSAGLLLGYDGPTATWKPQAASAPAPQPLDWLTDVTAPTPGDRRVLTWITSASRWEDAAHEVWPTSPDSSANPPSWPLGTTVHSPASHQGYPGAVSGTVLNVQYSSGTGFQLWSPYNTGQLWHRQHTGAAFGAWIPIGGESWQTPTLGGNWANVGGAYRTARYRKTGDVVEMEGMVKRTSGSVTVLFTLPTGYRPALTHTYAVGAKTGVHRLEVRADGVVQTVEQMAGTSDLTNFLTLEGVRFSTL